MFNKSNPNNYNKLQNKVFINGPFAIALYKHLNPSISLPAAVDPYADRHLTDDEARVIVRKRIIETFASFGKTNIVAGTDAALAKNLAGEALYERLRAIPAYFNDAAKMVGMFLEMDLPDVLLLLEDHENLLQKVEEALQVLWRHRPIAPATNDDDDEDRAPTDELRQYSERSPLCNPKEALALWKISPSGNTTSTLSAIREKMEKCFVGARPGHTFATPGCSDWAMWREQPRQSNN
jgi:hypothetical protein